MSDLNQETATATATTSSATSSSTSEDGKTSPTSTTSPIHNFERIILDMTTDFATTFPDYAYLWKQWSQEEVDKLPSQERRTAVFQALYDYCVRFYPERFFDILYLNDEIFAFDSGIDTCFLPSVDFKLLFNCPNVSEKTRKIMWNYLQLILITTVSSIDNKNDFGETTKQLFQGVDEKDLYEKLNETIESIGTFFQNMGNIGGTEGSDGEGESETANIGMEKDEEGEEDNINDADEEDGTAKSKILPDIKELYGHLNSLFNGKIGSLAKELAEEISGDMNQMFEGGSEGEPNMQTTKDLIQSLIKNPEKMTGLIKKVSDRLNTKISTGELSKEELLKEATDILGKMKGMGNKKEFQSLFKNITKMTGLGGAGGGAKFDMNAFQQMSTKTSSRDRLRQRMMQRKVEKEALLEKKIAAAAAAAAAAVASSTPPLEPSGHHEESVKYHIEPTHIPNNYKFVLDENEENLSKGDEDAVSVTVSPLVSEAVATGSQPSTHKKKKKNKNK